MNKYEELLGLVITAMFIALLVYLVKLPKDPLPTPVFEFHDHKSLPDGQHRYEIYHYGVRAGYVVLPESITGVEFVVVAVYD
jgi:hypothetical protein